MKVGVLASLDFTRKGFHQEKKHNTIASKIFKYFSGEHHDQEAVEFA